MKREILTFIGKTDAEGKGVRNLDLEDLNFVSHFMSQSKVGGDVLQTKPKVKTYSAQAKKFKVPMTKTDSSPPPRNEKEKSLSKYRKFYDIAEEVEMDGLEANGTWRLVPRSQVLSGSTILRNRFVELQLYRNSRIKQFFESKTNRI